MTDAAFERKIRELRERASGSVDGFLRTPAAEERINQLCRTALNGAAGDLLMDYIRSITTNVVLPATASDAELRMQEGMRRLAGILDARRNSKPKE